MSVFSRTVLFVSISQVIGCEDRLRNDRYCVEWGVKLYSNQPTVAVSARSRHQSVTHRRVAGASGRSTRDVTRRSHFRSGSGFHLRRGRDRGRGGRAVAADGERPMPTATIRRGRRDRSSNSTGHGDVVTTTCDTSTVTYRNRTAV